MGLVEPFKLLLRVTTHPQFLVLELRCPWVLDWDNTVYEISVGKILVLINFGRVNVLRTYFTQKFYNIASIIIVA